MIFEKKCSFVKNKMLNLMILAAEWKNNRNFAFGNDVEFMPK